jgi:hypothetical protein
MPVEGMVEVGKVGVFDQLSPAQAAVQRVQHLARLGSLDPQESLAISTLSRFTSTPNRFLVRISLSESSRSSEARALQLGNLVVDAGQLGFHEIESHDEEHARAAGRVNDAQSLQALAPGQPGIEFAGFPAPCDVGVVGNVRVFLRVFAQDAVEQLAQMRTQRLGYDEAGNVVGRVHHAVALASAGGAAGLFFLDHLVARRRLQPLHVGNGLFENVAEHRD